MKFCPFCGKAIDNNMAKFCKYCGKNLSASVTYDTSFEIPPVLASPPMVASNTDNVIPKPKTYMFLAVVASLFGFLPIGIYALCCSINVNKFYRKGLYAKAREVSNKAKKWSLFSFLAVFCFIILATIVSVFDNSDTKSTYDLPKETEEIVPVSPDESTPSDEGKDEDLLGRTRQLIEQGISETKQGFPMDIGNGMIMTEIVLKGDNVFYTYMCDEEILDISLIREFTTKDTLIDKLKNNSDRTLQYFLKLCKKAHIGFVYKFVGSSSGKSAVIRVPYEDIVINSEDDYYD